MYTITVITKMKNLKRIRKSIQVLFPSNQIPLKTFNENDSAFKYEIFDIEKSYITS